MNLAALKKKYTLQPPVLEIYETVKALSGKDVDFRELPELDVTARTKIARRRMPQHIILYDRRHVDHINHSLAHEFGHILRMSALPPEERLVPVAEDQHMRNAAERLSPETGPIPVAQRPRILTMWVSGLITQLINQPIDSRIEWWLADAYPHFAPEQARGLKAGIDIALKVLSAEVEQWTSPTVLRFSTAMNYAYLRAIGPLLNEDYLSQYKERGEITALGDQLYHWLEDETLSDLAVVNRWAETLDISDWFYWRDFEDMPESYYQD